MNGKEGLRARKVPVVFFTKVRKVESIGGDCIRIYCSVVSDNEWEDRVLIEIPIGDAISNSDFVTKAAREIVAANRTISAEEVKLPH